MRKYNVRQKIDMPILMRTSDLYFQFEPQAFDKQLHLVSPRIQCPVVLQV